MNLGDKILELRKKNNLSQEALAEEVGVSRQTISKWELNETSPDIKEAKKISEIFKVSLDELVGNNTKDILVEKVSNTEKLAGIIITILKVFGVLVILWIGLMIAAVILFTVGKKYNGPMKSSSIRCNLHDEEYSYEFHFEEETGIIHEAGGDGYLADVTNVEKYDNAYSAMNIIEEYVKNHGGTCERDE